MSHMGSCGGRRCAFPPYALPIGKFEPGPFDLLSKIFTLLQGKAILTR